MLVSTTKMLSNIHIWVVPLLLVLLQKSCALKCRSEDGPSDAELKRITRSCMRKVSENVHFSENGGNMGGYGSSLNTNYYYNSNGYHNNNNNNAQSHNNNHGRQNHHRSEYYDSDEGSDINDGDNYNYERRGNGRNNNGHVDNSQQRNRERNTMLSNRNGGANGGNGNSGNGGQRLNNGANNNSNGGSTSNQRNTNSKAYNNNNNNGNTNKPNNNNNGFSGSSGGGNGRNMGSSGNDNNLNNGTTYDSGCVVHCFFDEMNMLNRDGYPDRHKVNYMLTKDIRDQELRNFYVDTIQSCFRYLESRRRHDRCHFARELIQCMTEYAKANCDDWKEYNVIFN